MPRPRRPLPAALATAAFLLTALSGCAVPALRPVEQDPPTGLADLPAGLLGEVRYAPARANLLPTGRVLQVLSGDELVVDYGGPTHMRLVGLDAPETGGRPAPPEPLGAEAQRFASSVLSGREVRVGLGEEARYDGEGRTWAYIYLTDGTYFNALMVRAGLARTQPGPNSRDDELLQRLERRARAEGRGVWAP